MPIASITFDERARKNEQIVLQRLASVGLKQAADAAEVDESTISRWKEKLITQFCRVLARLGLKVVPETMRCFDPADIEAILHQAHKYMESVRTADQLRWED